MKHLIAYVSHNLVTLMPDIKKLGAVITSMAEKVVDTVTQGYCEVQNEDGTWPHDRTPEETQSYAISIEYIKDFYDNARALNPKHYDGWEEDCRNIRSHHTTLAKLRSSSRKNKGWNRIRAQLELVRTPSLLQIALPTLFIINAAI